MTVISNPVFANSFEGYTAGATVAVTAGSVAGPGALLGIAAGFGFSTVTVGANATLAYDTAVAHSGTASAKLTTGSSPGATWCGWTSAVFAPATEKTWWRMYVYQQSFPVSTHSIFEILGTGGTKCGDVTISTAGQVTVRSPTNTPVCVTTASVPLGQWFRLEGFFTCDASAGQAELKLFTSADSVTPEETQTSAAGLDLLGGANQWAFGIPSFGVGGITFWMDDLAVSDQGYIGPGALVQQLHAGAPVSGGFTAIAKASGGSSCALQVATDAGFTQVAVTTPAIAPDQYGYCAYTVTGLLSRTQYYCRILDTPPGGTQAPAGPVTGAVRTLPRAGTPESFTVSVVSCLNNADETPSPDAGVADWIAWNADLKIFTGDYSYYNPSYSDVADELAVIEAMNLFYGIGELTATAWGYSCRSNHDTGAETGDSGPIGSVPWIPYNVAAWQEAIPAGTLGDTTYSPVHGLQQAWAVGRVRFIMLDDRTVDRSPGANTDNSSKTMLGAAQLAWLYEQLTMPEPLKVVISDVQWVGSYTPSVPQQWASYNTERQAIISFIAANAAAVQGVMWWHGDTHCLATMTPAKNVSWGGFPVYCAAPLRQAGTGFAATWSQFWDNSAGECRQYGRVTFTDDGEQISVTFTGWDAAGQVARVSQTDVFAAPPAPGGGNVLLAFPA